MTYKVIAHNHELATDITLLETNDLLDAMHTIYACIDEDLDYGEYENYDYLINDEPFENFESIGNL